MWIKISSKHFINKDKIIGASIKSDINQNGDPFWLVLFRMENGTVEFDRAFSNEFEAADFLTEFLDAKTL